MRRKKLFFYAGILFLSFFLSFIFFLGFENEIPLKLSVSQCGNQRVFDSSNVLIYSKLNEDSGTNASDSSGNNNHGLTVNMNESNWVMGKLNNCLSFDGVDEYVNYGDIVDLTGNTPVSVEFWINRTTEDTTYHGILGKYDLPNSRGWQIIYI